MPSLAYKEPGSGGFFLKMFVFGDSNRLLDPRVFSLFAAVGGRVAPSLTCLEFSAPHLPRLSWGPAGEHSPTAQQGTPFNRRALAAFHM